MRLATFKQGNDRKVGIVDEAAGKVAAFQLSAAEAENGIQHIVELQVDGQTLPATDDPVAFSDVCLEAPIPRPRRNVFCVGKNYHDHAHEFSSSGYDSSASMGAVPEFPIVFSKVPESVVGPDANIEYDPQVTTQVDYEVELAVIIGKGGRGISKENALDHVWGYTIINDVTARDLQQRYAQWLVGKSQDTFCPMGPIAVTRDEIDLGSTGVRTFVNDEKRQDSNTSLLIFDVPTIIQTIAEGVTLVPGDVIATGTPAGVGLGFKPPKFMTHGDVVRCEIDGIGSLQNTLQQIGG